MYSATCSEICRPTKPNGPLWLLLTKKSGPAMVEAFMDTQPARIEWRQVPLATGAAAAIRLSPLATGDQTVDLYRVPLEVSAKDLQLLRSVLSEEEINAAE